MDVKKTWSPGDVMRQADKMNAFGEFLLVPPKFHAKTRGSLIRLKQ
jgi:hypothetical protein